MNKLKAIHFLAKVNVFVVPVYALIYSIIGLVNSLCELI